MRSSATARSPSTRSTSRSRRVAPGPGRKEAAVPDLDDGLASNLGADPLGANASDPGSSLPSQAAALVTFFGYPEGTSRIRRGPPSLPRLDRRAPRVKRPG